MSNSEDVDDVFVRLMPIECNIPGVTKRNEQFTQVRPIHIGPADLGVSLQQQELLRDGFGSAIGCTRILCGEKSAAAFEAGDCASGNDHSWHCGGASASSAVPHVASQVLVSSPVR